MMRVKNMYRIIVSQNAKELLQNEKSFFSKFLIVFHGSFLCAEFHQIFKLKTYLRISKEREESSLH